ncbi:MAG: hypothetical protein A3G34_08180 [Candidatus Lindowbacteria bacterium RIFCSPLOWO2_12_FULL_62_27]|nr:MAG: hypothetical protein A3G34_08180 [Candidatus Lindowbacteria bacterium RIFCSPLOWO2_12_FULL_62_27]OGH62331.1 MAG: hypothetical protein A3I06_00245 [Candidatus Lindowbacteria bacterium RIFCSPLOWO2_02_FULL_62_12]
MGKVRTGLDRVAAKETAAVRAMRGLKIGLLAHPASVDRRLAHAAEIFSSSRAWKLAALFSPQHGWQGEAQDNMIVAKDPPRVHSLYGAVREPTAKMLAGIDAVVVDLQDVGTRVYTFVQTLYLVMRACARRGKKVIVLDRPNPIGGAVEGPTLDPAYASFVGLTPLPLRHGMTIGEVARWYRTIDPGIMEPTVIGMRGGRRAIYFDDTGLPWVMPSPNMPAVDTAVVYPGTVLFEGTSLSEGRGTTRPFEIIGAPGVPPDRLARELESYRLPGARFRALRFQPTFNKHAGRICGGVQIHVTDRRAFRATLTGAAILKAFRRLDRGFRWKKPPYEYEYRNYPIDILAGTDRLRRMIDGDAPVSAFREWFESDARAFQARRRAEGFAG